MGSQEHSPEPFEVGLIGVLFFQEVELARNRRLLAQSEFEKPNADVPQCVHGIAPRGFLDGLLLGRDGDGWRRRCRRTFRCRRRCPRVEPDTLPEDVGAMIGLGAKLAGPLLPDPDMGADLQAAIVACALDLQFEQIVSGFPAGFGPVRTSGADP